MDEFAETAIVRYDCTIEFLLRVLETLEGAAEWNVDHTAVTVADAMERMISAHTLLKRGGHRYPIRCAPMGVGVIKTFDTS